MQIKLFYFFSAFLLILSIFIEATQPPSIGNGMIPHFDKLVHFCAFGFLAFLLVKVFKPSGTLIQWLDVFVICLVVLGVTIADEFIQTFNATRHASLGDISAGCLGALSIVSVIKYRRSCVKK